MTATLLVKQCGIDNFEWLSVSETQGNSSYQVGDGERLRDACQHLTNSILLIAAETVTLRRVKFDKHEKKLLRQTLPYTLEEDCIEDVDALHFAMGTVAEDSVPVALINRERLADALLDVEQEEVEIRQLVSELSFVPLPENGWSILICNERWLVRVDESRGFALEAETACFALQLLLDENEHLPEVLRVYSGAADHNAILASLPELLRGVVDWLDEDYWQVMAAGYQQQLELPSSVNLLQGDFARSLPWKRWWKNWRLIVILFLAAILVQFASTFTQLQVLESRNVELRAELERAYRDVVPQGAVIDPEKQLRRKVNALKGGGDVGFIPLFAQVAEVLATVDGLVVQSLNYTEKQDEIRVTILANGFNDVESTRATLASKGLLAELTGSNAEGNKTRARLRVRSQ